MTTYLKQINGKLVKLNPSTDETIYASPRQNGNGNDCFRGIDLMAHKVQDNKVYFYFLYWSRYANERDGCEPCGIEEIKAFIIEQSGAGLVSEQDFDKLKQYGIEFEIS